MTDLLTFIDQLRDGFRHQTSELPDLWTVDNPSTGQCHVTALLIQEFFGGDIVEGIAETLDAVSVHYWNVIDGVTVDATRDQFPVDAQITGGVIAGPPNVTTLGKSVLLGMAAGIYERPHHRSRCTCPNLDELIIDPDEVRDYVYDEGAER